MAETDSQKLRRLETDLVEAQEKCDRDLASPKGSGILSRNCQNAASLRAQIEELKRKIGYFDDRWIHQCVLSRHVRSFAQFRADLRRYTAGLQTPAQDRTNVYNKMWPIRGRPSTLINKLIMKTNEQALLDIKAEQLSEIQPYLRLYKVYYDSEGKFEKEIEFKFDTYLDNIMDNVDPGRAGYGIKSFDWEFNGSNLATIKNDISANLVLYFQNFNDLLKQRSGNDILNFGTNVPYRFLDLIVPAPGRAKPLEDDAEVEEETTGSPCGDNDLSNEYLEEDFEVKAIVGWQLPALGTNSTIDPTLQSAISNSRATLFLLASDYVFNINHDVTHTLTINYRGRLEGLGISTKMNVLKPHDPALYDKMVALERSLESIEQDKEKLAVTAPDDDEALKSETEKLQDVKEQITELQDEINLSKFEHILSLLDEKQEIYSMDITKEYLLSERDVSPLQLTHGTVARTRDPKTAAATHAAATTPIDDPDALELDQVLKNMRTASQQLFFRVGADGSATDPVPGEVVEFFYLGDLVDAVAADVMSPPPPPAPGNPLTLNVGGGDLGRPNRADRYSYLSPDIAEKIKIILGDIDLIDPVNGDCLRVSLADIPISVLTFTEFFFKKVIKSRKQQYGFVHFIRDVIQDLVVISLGTGVCPNNQTQGVISVRNNFVSSPAVGNEDPLNTKISREEKPGVWTGQLSSAAVRNPGSLFFPNTTTAWTPTADMYHYLVIYAFDTNIDFEGEEAHDRANGVYHVHFARDRGLLKEGNFSKTAAPYLRETRATLGGFNPIKIL